MTFFRIGIPAIVLSLSSCGHSPAPEPYEFKLSAEALTQQYRSWRGTDTGRLYAGKIQTIHDEEGRRSYVASEGALLVIDALPPIYAQAPDISITPEFTEVLGKSTVKKNDRLYIGQDDSTKIRIEGSTIKPEGPHVIRRIADEAETEASPPAKPESPETVSTQPAPTPTPGAAEPPAAPPSEPIKEKPVSKPKVKRPPPAKPKAPPAVDRTRLLNLMREPTVR